MGVFAIFEGEEKRMVPTLVPPGGFYRTARTMAKSVCAGRVLCSEDCHHCGHFANGACTQLDQLNLAYEQELVAGQEKYFLRKKAQKQEARRKEPELLCLGVPG